MPEREAQQVVIEREAKAAQHALAEPALEHVDVVFEGAVDEDEREEDRAQRHQIRNLVEREAVEILGKLFAENAAIDDRLRQII